MIQDFSPFAEIGGIHENAEILKDIVHSFIPTDFYERRAPVAVDFEKQQKLPSYLFKTKRPTRLV